MKINSPEILLTRSQVKQESFLVSMEISTNCHDRFVNIYHRFRVTAKLRFAYPLQLFSRDWRINQKYFHRFAITIKSFLQNIFPAAPAPAHASPAPAAPRSDPK